MSITAETPGIRPAAPPPPQRRRNRWLAAAAVAAALTGGLVVTQLPSGEPEKTTVATAAQVLQRSANKVGAAGIQVAQGQYRYSEWHAWYSEARDTSNMIRLTEDRTERWIPADRTDVWMERENDTGRYQWTVGSDEQAAEEGDWPPPEKRVVTRKAPCGAFHPESGVDFCDLEEWSRPSSAWLKSLPRDPQKLLDFIRHRKDEPVAGHVVLDEIGQALRSGEFPADLQAALYEAAALLPDIKITEGVANLDGRNGTALGLDSGRRRDEIIIDQRTGEFIGARTSKLDAAGKVEYVLSFTAVDFAVVDKMGQRPSK